MLNSKTLISIKAFTPAILWALVIFIFSEQEMLPSLTLSALDFVFKKTAHIFVYAVLYFLLLKGFQKIGYSLQKIWLKVLIICFLYAVSDELHQGTVAGRTATARDVGYDMLGASLIFLRQFGYI
jgi:VanZ family protein